MVPQLYRSIGPAYRPVQAGIAAAAEAGVAREIAGLGGQISQYAEQQRRRSDVLAASRAWRQLDTWRIQYLQDLPGRRKTLAGTLLDPETGDNVTGYEQELRNFPDSLNAEHARLSEGLSRNARAMLEERFNLHAPSWSAQAVETLRTLETEDVTGEILGLASDDRTSDAMELLDQYADRYSPADRARIEGTIAKAGQESQMKGAQDYLIGLAASGGWEAADKVLQDPEFLKTYGLDLVEAGTLKSQLDKWVSDNRSMAETKQRAQLEANNDAIIADARQGKLDLTTLWDKVRANEVDATVAEQARRIVLEPRTENDPAAYARLEDTLDGFARGSISQGQAKAELDRIAGELKPSTFEGARATITNTYSAQVQARQDVVMRARGQLVDVANEQDWATLMVSITAPELAEAAGAKRKRQLAQVSSVEDELDQFIKRKPDASREEILRMGRIITAEVGGTMPPAAASPWGEVPLPENQPSTLNNQPSAAPAGLETLWPTLNDAEKSTVRMLLGRGFTAERILQEAGR